MRLEATELVSPFLLHTQSPKHKIHHFPTEHNRNVTMLFHPPDLSTEHKVTCISVTCEVGHQERTNKMIC